VRAHPQAALHAAGLALFARGFLLTRVELTGVSSCADVAHLPPPPGAAASAASAADSGAADCWVAPPVRKAVLLLVDGLRWDVAAGRAASGVAGRNLSLPSLAALVAAHGPSAATLLPFVADPPTTTQQRLKGLLTGAHNTNAAGGRVRC
jgi:phosphatidylinositol glycan class O